MGNSKILLPNRQKHWAEVCEEELLDALFAGITLPNELIATPTLLTARESLEAAIRSQIEVVVRELFGQNRPAVVETRLVPDASDFILPERPSRMPPVKGEHTPRVIEARFATPERRAQRAWMQRAKIFSVHGRPPLALGFLKLVDEKARVAYTVEEAAQEMGIARRALERFSDLWFDFPPGLVIDLGRIFSVAKDIRDSGHALKYISARHAFPAPSIMGRLFTRFLGVSPSLYRAGSGYDR